MFKKSIALAAAAVVAGVLGFAGTSDAAPRRLFIPPMGGGMSGMHHHMNGGMGPMGEFRHHSGGGDDWWRHRHHHHHHGDDGDVFLGFGFAPYPYYDDYAYDDYYDAQPDYYAGNAHVRWCFAHYRTYDPRSDTYIGSDGYRHHCRSRTSYY